MHRHLIGHGRRGRTWSRRVRENMKVSERQVLDETAVFLKEFVGFTGESYHYVGADGRVWHGFMNLANLFRVVPRAIFAMHPAQNAVTAGLQRNMRVPGDSRRTSDQRDQ